jgi:Ser/Thr protein kinase RdoA (MazF antagonist)
MNKIERGTKVKYIGKTNDYTYELTIYQNSYGVVKNVFIVENRTTYEIEFENGLTTAIDEEDITITF